MLEEAEGYKVIRVWANDLYHNMWVLGEKEDDSTKKKTFKTFSLGSDYDMAGCGDGSGAPKWRSPKIPENTWFVEIHS